MSENQSVESQVKNVLNDVGVAETSKASNSCQQIHINPKPKPTTPRIINDVIWPDRSIVKDVGLRTKIAKMKAKQSLIESSKGVLVPQPTSQRNSSLQHSSYYSSKNDTSVATSSKASNENIRIEILSDVQLKDPSEKLPIDSLIIPPQTKRKTLTFIRGANSTNIKRLNEIQQNSIPPETLITSFIDLSDQEEVVNSDLISTMSPTVASTSINQNVSPDSQKSLAQPGNTSLKEPHIVYAPSNVKINLQALLKARLKNKEQLATDIPLKSPEFFLEESDCQTRTERFIKDKSNVEFIPLHKPVPIKFNPNDLGEIILNPESIVQITNQTISSTSENIMQPNKRELHFLESDWPEPSDKNEPKNRPLQSFESNITKVRSDNEPKSKKVRLNNDGSGECPKKVNATKDIAKKVTAKIIKLCRSEDFQPNLYKVLSAKTDYVIFKENPSEGNSSFSDSINVNVEHNTAVSPEATTKLFLADQRTTKPLPLQSPNEIGTSLNEFTSKSPDEFNGFAEPKSHSKTMEKLNIFLKQRNNGKNTEACRILSFSPTEDESKLKNTQLKKVAIGESVTKDVAKEVTEKLLYIFRKRSNLIPKTTKTTETDSVNPKPSCSQIDIVDSKENVDAKDDTELNEIKEVMLEKDSVKSKPSSICSQINIPDLKENVKDILKKDLIKPKQSTFRAQKGITVSKENSKIRYHKKPNTVEEDILEKDSEKQEPRTSPTGIAESRENLEVKVDEDTVPIKVSIESNYVNEIPELNITKMDEAKSIMESENLEIQSMQLDLEIPNKSEFFNKNNSKSDNVDCNLKEEQHEVDCRKSIESNVQKSNIKDNEPSNKLCKAETSRKSHSDSSVQEYISKRDLWKYYLTSESEDSSDSDNSSDSKGFVRSLDNFEHSTSKSKSSANVNQGKSIISLLSETLDRKTLVKTILEFEKQKFNDDINSDSDESSNCLDDIDADDEDDDADEDIKDENDNESDNVKEDFHQNLGEDSEKDCTNQFYGFTAENNLHAETILTLNQYYEYRAQQMDLIIKKEFPDSTTIELNGNIQNLNVNTSSTNVCDGNQYTGGKGFEVIPQVQSATSSINTGRRKRTEINYRERGEDEPALTPKRRYTKKSTVDLTPAVNRTPNSIVPITEHLDSSAELASLHVVEMRQEKSSKRGRTKIKKEPVDNVAKTSQFTTPAVPQETKNRLTKQTNTSPSPSSPLILNTSIGKRGRKPKNAASTPVSLPDILKCGNCNEKIPQQNWNAHLDSHYGLAWIDGIQEPVDMTNINAQASQMTRYAKIANVKVFTCEKCNEIKRSAIGYLSHVEVCGLTAEERLEKMVKCKYCPSILRSASVAMHEQHSCSGIVRTVEACTEQITELSSDSTIDEPNRTRPLRTSAKKAIRLFKECDMVDQHMTLADIEKFIVESKLVTPQLKATWKTQLDKTGHLLCERQKCTFETWSVDEMKKHFKQCRPTKLMGPLFICKLCKYGPNKRDTIMQHIIGEHKSIENYNDRDFSVSESDYKSTKDDGSSSSDYSSGVDESEILAQEDHCIQSTDIEGDEISSTKSSKPRSSTMETFSFDKKVLSEYTETLRQCKRDVSNLTKKWTLEFHAHNYTTELLFPQFLPVKTQNLTIQQLKEYQPIAQISHKFSFQRATSARLQKPNTIPEKDWQNLNLYQSVNGNESHTLYCGGSILACEWIPTPDDYVSAQYLAISCKLDAKESYPINITIKTKSQIQIWCVEHLQNEFNASHLPRLLYQVAYDYGPIYHMQFCPSGGLSDDRLGLLAVSSTNGSISILSLPKYTNDCDNNQKTLKIEPSVTLSCNLNDAKHNMYVNRIEWSKEAGHSIIVGGYNNGFVAIWDLSNLSSSLLCRPQSKSSTKEDTKVLLPHQTFYAFTSVICQLNLHYDHHNNSRWLLVGGFDRKIKFYDLQNTDPIEITLTMLKSRVINGCWPLHWTLFFSIVDDAYALGSGAMCRQPLDVGSRITAIYQSVGHSCDISFSDWLNVFIFVNDYGSIYVAYPSQFISGFMDSMRRIRGICGFTDVVCDNKSTSLPTIQKNEKNVKCFATQPQSIYVDPHEEIVHNGKSGIVFYDHLKPVNVNQTPIDDSRRTSMMDSSVNLNCINKVIFNPNANSYKCYALGYESGFVRIMFLNPM